MTNKISFTMLGGLTALLALFTSHVAAAQSLVVRSTGPSAASFPAGKKFDANVKITLKDKDQVTVLDEAGTRVLQGPGDYVLDGRVSADRNRYANMSRSLKSTQAVRAGAVRGANSAAQGEESLSPSIWFVDMRKGGKTCVPAESNLVLWRQNVEVGQFFWLGQESGGMMQRVYWGRGTRGVTWPSAVAPMENGYTYFFHDDTGVEGTAAAPDVMVELSVLETVPENPAELAGLLLEKQCLTQFDYLVKRMADGAVAPVAAES